MEQEIFQTFTQPSITVLSGPTGAGKTSTLREIFLKNQINCIDKLVLMCEYPEENVYKQIKAMAILKNPNCKFICFDENKNVSQILKQLHSKECNVLIIDDQINAKDFQLGKVAGVDSRHKNCTTFLITQNIFSDTKDFVHFRRQTRYFIVFTNGDSTNIRFFRNRFPDSRMKHLPVSRFYLGDSQTGHIFDDRWQRV